METWRDRARRRMKERGVTQDSLAVQLDITQGGLQHWLAGSRQPSLDQINKIAKALDAPPAWLTHGLDSDDSLDGLDDTARFTLRRFISAERRGLLHVATWQTLSSLADVALAQANDTDTDTQNKPLGAPLNAEKAQELEQLAMRAEEEHARGPRKRQKAQT